MPYGFLDDITNAGANWLYSASGLYRQLGLIEKGPLYIDAVSETTATGYYTGNWGGDGRVDMPTPTITWVADPSGYAWISASGVDYFVVSFENTPVDDNFITTPLLVGHWQVVL